MERKRNPGLAIVGWAEARALSNCLSPPRTPKRTRTACREKDGVSYRGARLSALHCGRSDCIRVVVPGGRPSAVCATARGSRSRLRPLDVSGRRLRSRRDVLATPVTRTASKKIAVIDEDRGEKPVSCRSPDEAKRNPGAELQIAPTLPALRQPLHATLSERQIEVSSTCARSPHGAQRYSLTDNGWRRVRRQLLCSEPSRAVMQSGRAGSLVSASQAALRPDF